jgi:hypothetical protein
MGFSAVVRRAVIAGLMFAAVAASGQVVDRRYRVGKVLFADDFRHGMGEWRVELERPGSVAASGGLLDIDVPAGATVWFRRELSGPVMIQYEATAVSAGGANDRVSDLNCFWMATDPASPGNIFARPRTGAFAGYNALRLYYVGLGGNGNTTTRFRRYVGDAVDRPLLPENDLSVAQHPEVGIVANRTQTVTLVADRSLIQYWRDGVKIFEMIDPAPYTQGWFGIRTTQNHLQVRKLRVYRLADNR